MFYTRGASPNKSYSSSSSSSSSKSCSFWQW